MLPTIKVWSFLLMALLLASTLGCEGGKKESTTPFEEAQLKEIHEIYQHFIKSQQKAPNQLSDLTQKRYQGIHPATVQALEEGKYTVVFGVTGKDSGTILAYETAAPTKGGAVLLADGNVKRMTPDEFKVANKS